MTGDPRWRKSSFSGGTQNACVELDFRVDSTAVRDSKHPDSGLVTVGPDGWAAFLAMVKQGGLDG